LGYDPRALATVDDLLALDVRVGTIVAARVLRGARTPSFALSISFGELGRKAACAALTDLYETEDIVGLQVAAVVNVPPEAVAGLVSEVRVLTVDDGKGGRVLLIPERPVPDGGRLQ
jgi:tRNA-binding protein